jgi:hypothetical protein
MKIYMQQKEKSHLEKQKTMVMTPILILSLILMIRMTERKKVRRRKTSLRLKVLKTLLV